MSLNAEKTCGLSGWSTSFHLGVSHWSTPDAGSNGELRFLTLNKIGGVGPATSTVSWSLELQLSEDFHDASTRLFSNGYTIQTESGYGLQAFIPSPGVFLLQGPANLVGQLFCAEREISGDSQDRLDSEDEADESFAQWINLDGQLIHLTSRLSGDKHRTYCLQITSLDEAAAIERALNYIEIDVAAEIDREVQQRTPFFEQHPASRENPLTLLAFETLVSHLEPSNGQIRGRWLADGLDPAPLLDTNRLFAAISTWNLIDIEVSKDLVRSVLSTQQNNGGLHAQIDPHNTDAHFIGTWPLLAQCCREIWDAIEAQSNNSNGSGNSSGKSSGGSGVADTTFFDEVLPRIDEHVQFSAEYFSLEASGYHGWHTADEGLVPEIFDDNLVSIPLTTMLICETEELQFFSRVLMDFRPEKDVLNELKIRLTRNLAEGWNEKAHAYTNYYLNGDPVNRVSIGSYFPMRWSGVDPALATEMEKQLKSSESLITPDGVALWQSWETDEIQGRVEAAHQIFMPLILSRSGLVDQQGSFSQGITNAQQTWYKSGAGLVDELALDRNEFGDVNTPDRGTLQQDLSAACLHLTSQIRSQTMDVNISDYPWIIRWLERNRQTFTTLVTLLFFIAVVITAVSFAKAKKIGWRGEYTMQGLARNRYQIGNYDEAISLYTDLIKISEKPSVTGDYQFMLANAYYQTENYELAEKFYRASMENSGASVPQPQWNLTQTLYRMGRYDEARTNLEGWIEKFGEHFPNMERRAETVFTLIQSQIERRQRQGV